MSAHNIHSAHPNAKSTNTTQIHYAYRLKRKNKSEMNALYGNTHTTQKASKQASTTINMRLRSGSRH